MTDSTFKHGMSPSLRKYLREGLNVSLKVRYDVEINEHYCNSEMELTNGGQYWAMHNSFDTFEEAEQEIIDCLYSGTDSDDSSDYRISVKILDSNESLYSTYGGHANWNWY